MLSLRPERTFVTVNESRRALVSFEAEQNQQGWSGG